ncbi:MAG TPA: M42 family metallopeptidase [Longimicrobiaceae bacterium]|nr:M42 family metallopeptidase [Longimicrobiaceae bacterium]
MRDSSFDFLKRLLDAPGPSGFEIVPARIWRAEAEGIADRVEPDVAGNSIATLNPEGSPVVMLAGHIDEIGLMVTHVDDEGFLYFDGIGGWDPQVLVAQRIRVLTRHGEVRGVVGKKPIHLIKGEEKEKAAKVTDLWIDVGARSRAEAEERGIRVGDPAVIDTGLVELGNSLIASRSIDNRIGAFVVLEALRLIREGGGSRARVTAAATTQEEIGFAGGGARACAFALDPQIALVVDVSFATDSPGMEKKELGVHRLGGGPILARGSSTHPLVFERLAATAEAEGIPYSIQANPKYSSTDADAIYLSRAGVATGVISVPNRYMHSPSEIVSLDDLEAAARLIAAFVKGIGDADEFIPR